MGIALMSIESLYHSIICALIGFSFVTLYGLFFSQSSLLIIIRYKLKKVYPGHALRPCSLCNTMYNSLAMPDTINPSKIP